MTIPQDPGRLALRFFRVPDPVPDKTIAFLQTLPELDGVIFANSPQGDCETVVTVRGADAPAARARIIDVFGKRHGSELFSTDGSTVDDILARQLVGHGLVITEAGTDGCILARITAQPAVAACVVGGFSSAAAPDRPLDGVTSATLLTYGAITPDAARHMATDALAAAGDDADTALAVTGLIGSAETHDASAPGTVCLCAITRAGATLSYEVALVGDQTEMRLRAAALAMHALRALRGPQRLRVIRPIDI